MRLTNGLQIDSTHGRIKLRLLNDKHLWVEKGTDSYYIAPRNTNLPFAQVMNGRMNCGGNDTSDEDKPLARCHPRTEFRCRGNGQCVERKYINNKGAEEDDDAAMTYYLRVVS